MTIPSENYTVFHSLHVETSAFLILFCEWSTWIFYLHVLMNSAENWQDVDFNVLVTGLALYGVLLFSSSIGYKRKSAQLFQLLIFLQFVRLWGFTGIVLGEAATVKRSLYFDVAFYSYYAIVLLLFYGEMYLSLKYFRYLSLVADRQGSPVIKIDMFSQNMFQSPIQEGMEVARAKYDSPVALHNLFDYHDDVVLV